MMACLFPDRPAFSDHVQGSGSAELSFQTCEDRNKVILEMKDLLARKTWACSL